MATVVLYWTFCCVIVLSWVSCIRWYSHYLSFSCIIYYFCLLKWRQTIKKYSIEFHKRNPRLARVEDDRTIWNQIKTGRRTKNNNNKKKQPTNEHWISYFIGCELRCKIQFCGLFPLLPLTYKWRYWIQWITKIKSKIKLKKKLQMFGSDFKNCEAIVTRHVDHSMQCNADDCSNRLN